MVGNISNQDTTEDLTEEIDETRIFRQDNFLHLLMRMLCLCLVLMNILHSVAHPSCDLVTMAILIPHWDATSDFLSQARDSPVWISIRDVLFPPEILALRTAGSKWNHAKLYGSFAALWFFLMEKG